MTRFFYTRDECEARAMQLLIRYQQRISERVSLPIDVALIGEDICGLTWDWAEIPDDAGHPVWGRLRPQARRVEMNERFTQDFQRNQGLDRFTRAHEIGHWELHAVHSNPDQLALVPLDPAPEMMYCRGGDGSWIETHADWFAAALLMPYDLFRTAARSLDLHDPSGLATLKTWCDVSWQALQIRLETLHIPFTPRPGYA